MSDFDKQLEMVRKKYNEKFTEYITNNKEINKNNLEANKICQPNKIVINNSDKIFNPKVSLRKINGENINNSTCTNNSKNYINNLKNCNNNMILENPLPNLCPTDFKNSSSNTYPTDFKNSEKHNEDMLKSITNEKYHDRYDRKIKIKVSRN